MSDYDSRAIEKKATNEVERYFENSKIVATYINDGDKEPFFDGHIYLYAGGKRDNKHYTGRVAVQIKGENLGEFKDGVYSYPIEMTDLKAYLHEGIAFFVVQEVKRKKKLYYKLLSPIELRALIRKKKGQESVSIRMRYATSRDIKKLEIELLQFEYDCKKQISYADAPTFDFKELDKLGIHKFSMDLAVRDKKISFLQAVTTKPIYLYANMPGGAKIPIGDGPANISLMREIELPVVIGGHQFFDKIKTIMQNGMQTINVGDCFSITIDPSGKKKEALLNVQRGARLLKEVIRESEFLLALKDKKRIQIGTLLLNIPFPDENDVTKGLERYLTTWYKLDEILVKMHCNKDMDLSIVKKADEKTIDIIIDMIGNGKELSLKNASIGINNVHIANLKLWLFVYKNEEGKYIVKDFFDKSICYKVEYEYPEGKLKESIYSWFNREKLLECDRKEAL